MPLTKTKQTKPNNYLFYFFSFHFLFFFFFSFSFYIHFSLSLQIQFVSFLFLFIFLCRSFIKFLFHYFSVFIFYLYSIFFYNFFFNFTYIKYFPHILSPFIADIKSLYYIFTLYCSNSHLNRVIKILSVILKIKAVSTTIPLDADIVLANSTSKSKPLMPCLQQYQETDQTSYTSAEDKMHQSLNRILPYNRSSISQSLY